MSFSHICSCRRLDLEGGPAQLPVLQGVPGGKVGTLAKCRAGLGSSTSGELEISTVASACALQGALVCATLLLP